MWVSCAINHSTCTYFWNPVATWTAAPWNVAFKFIFDIFCSKGPRDVWLGPDWSLSTEHFLIVITVLPFTACQWELILLQSDCLASHLQEHFGHVSGRANAESGNTKSASLQGICCCRVADMDRQVLCGFSQACFRCVVKAALLVLNADRDL